MPVQPKLFRAVALLEWLRCTEIGQAAELLGVVSSTPHNWIRRDVYLTLSRAEGFAERLGVHPVEVWPEWFDVSVLRSCYGDELEGVDLPIGECEPATR
jgi:hypothetical protein